MGIEDLTEDEILAELARQILIDKPPGEGWRTASDIVPLMRQMEGDQSLTYETIRKRLQRKVNQGVMERWQREPGTEVYYRLAK